MSSSASPNRGRRRASWVSLVIAGVVAAALGPLFLVVLLGAGGPSRQGCGASAGSGGIALTGAGGGPLVGASEYGGPGDPSSGHVGASGMDLDVHPDSYAELGGTSFTSASAMGGLAYETPLRVTWGGHSAIAYKRDFGLGGGPIDGLPRVVDLWWRFAAALGIPYDDGRWSGPVRVQRPPAAGAGNLLGVSLTDALPASTVGGAASPGCDGSGGVGAAAPLTPGPRARLLPDGRAAAPAAAPAAVKGMIAAGNAIAGLPYVYGGGHGLPLSTIAPSYDCSSSVEHLLWGGGLVAADAGTDSGGLETFGAPGPGRWVTIYASPDHVFMYVAGLRWDTHNAAGPDDGSTGIGWHPLVREADGFVARHPVGL